MSDTPIAFRLLDVCDVVSARAVREHLYLLGVTPQEQELLPGLASEVKAREHRLLGGDPLDPSRTTEVIAEVAAGSTSTADLEALNALLYIVAAFTEDESQQEQRRRWGRVFYSDSWQALLDSLGIPTSVRSAIGATIDSYRIRTGRISALLQEADAKWMAAGQPTLAPEHEVDGFGIIAGRRYFLEMARIIRLIATEGQVAALEEAGMRLVGFDLRLP